MKGINHFEELFAEFGLATEKDREKLLFNAINPLDEKNDTIVTTVISSNTSISKKVGVPVNA